MIHVCRAIGLVVFGWLFTSLLFVHALQFPVGAPAPIRFLSPAVLGVHEAGHVIIGTLLPSQQLLVILAGSLAQWAAPALFCAFFLWRRQTFSAAVMLGFTAISLLFSVPYINDATARALPLFPSHDAVHDWNWILSSLHLLGKERSIATGFAFTAKLWLILSLAGMTWSTLWPLHKRMIYRSKGIIELKDDPKTLEPGMPGGAG